VKTLKLWITIIIIISISAYAEHTYKYILLVDGFDCVLRNHISSTSQYVADKILRLFDVSLDICKYVRSTRKSRSEAKHHAKLPKSFRYFIFSTFECMYVIWVPIVILQQRFQISL
jgi:hypothetical protein